MVFKQRLINCFDQHHLVALRNFQEILSSEDLRNLHTGTRKKCFSGARVATSQEE